jgi:ferredoxin-NADP reductase
VKREETGFASRFLHDHIREGAEIGVSGPGGRFTFTGNEAMGLVLIGAGVGITPLMSVIRYLTDKNWPGAIDLIYCARTERDIIFRQELESLAAAFPNLRVTTTLTREPGVHWPGQRGRISAELLRRTVPDLLNRRVHICGPVEMADDVRRMLLEAGAAAEQIRSEAFGGPAPKPSAAAVADDAGPVIGAVTFSESGKTAPAHCGQTVLDIASRVGVSIDRGCLAGICGRCRVRLLSGHVKMEVDEVLNDAEKRSGLILACQSKPRGSVAIEA